MPAALRILLVDDNADFLASLAAFLNRFDHLEVVASVRSARECLEHAAELAPDVVLLDLAMPDCNGLEATRRLRAAGCRARIIILTLLTGAPYRESAQRAGADVFVSKNDITASLVPTIDSLFPVGEEPTAAT